MYKGFGQYILELTFLDENFEYLILEHSKGWLKSLASSFCEIHHYQQFWDSTRLLGEVDLRVVSPLEND
jgi:hypothetical protein